MVMKTLKISKGGQVSVPAEVRQRWKTSTVEVEDRGDEIVLRPAPDDPIAALRGALKGGKDIPTERLFAELRAEEAEIEARRFGRT
jgi:AbrB family looped-hinge helix DNA binding protein